jgi:hypothetical protein
MRIKWTRIEAFFKFNHTFDTQERRSNYLKILLAFKLKPSSSKSLRILDGKFNSKELAKAAQNKTL